MTNKAKFIINTSVEYFSAIPATDFELDEQLATVIEFLENDELTVIAAVHEKCSSIPSSSSDSEGKIKFYHHIPNNEVCLLFYKIPQVGGSSGNNSNIGGNAKASSQANTNGNASGNGNGLSNAAATLGYQPLGILTLEGGLVKSIYNSVSRVFSPQAEVRKTEYSSELSGLLESLHVSLGLTLGLPQSEIASVKEEIKYWKQKLNQKSSARKDREMAEVFIRVLENIEKQMGTLNNRNNNNSTDEFLDSINNILDELWRLPYNYPQNRMTDLLDIIGNRLLEVCIEQLYAEDIWNYNLHHINNLLSQCIDTVDAWMQICDALTRLFWPNYVQHPWVGEPHVPKCGHLFKERLAEIRNIRNLFKQVATLLEDEEVRSMFYANSPFDDINIFDTTSLGQTKWNKALQIFEQILQPIDERIASALKSQLHNHLSNPRQVIFIFSKYETLIQRPTVLELLTIEREQFLQSLQLLLQDLRKAMTDTNMEPDAGHLSVICNECRWLKVVQYQIQEIEKVSHLISGREGYDKIYKAVQEIKEETESLLRTNFEIWCGQCFTAVKSGELKLRDDQPVVRFEKEGRQLMRVSFNPKLVTFCQDVREFENLGYTVPTELRAAAMHAVKFICYARRLQQIATFHNTIGDRMIPCQRPIMLKNAVELSKLVQSETVAWNDEESVQRYVNMLQVAVSKLSSDNTLLVGYHEEAKRTVIKLMNTDLFTQNQVWKDEMRHLRELVATLERQGFTNLDAFKLHWDHQLYKVLEYQYIIGLVDMNNKLPDIHVDIVFRQRQLCFRPPEEEIREKYFTQLRRFIERPSSFRGLSDNSVELFKKMVEVNRHHFGPLFEKAQELFRKLEDFKKLWLPWVALGCVDVEELCGIHLSKAQDWDRNFKACKNFSQKIAKLQNTEESIDCIVINISPLRSDVEFISRRYWEALANSLRASILNDIAELQQFLQDSLKFLQNVPMDETSLTESSMKYEKMTSQLPKISETLALVKGKDTCLAGWCKERVSALTGILLQWDKLQPLIENHAVILQRQVNLLKDQATAHIQNLRNEAEKCNLRWESTISELEANEDATLELFKERQEHWKQIQLKKTQLLEECAQFNMEFPAETLAIFSEIETKMQEQSKQWEVYDTYLTELNAILKEEWAIYRRRPYVLNEFISKWEGSIHSSIDLPSKRIRQNVERLQYALPVLQQLQSDALTERHWAKIFMLLKKPETKPIHNILLEDIVEDGTALQHAAAEISNIVKQAASEQIVRQALTELDQWSVTAKLKLISHKNSTGEAVPLIKDFQEVLNKIGDNQSLLQSAKNSAAFDVFSDQADIWESRLNALDTILTSLTQSQRRWVYLEPVFGAGTLKNEEALFKRIDKDFRYVMREIQNDPRVISLIKINNITAIVNSLETQLARCQNNLMSYIMEKRNSFPRFYFLGDDDLLEILGQASKDVEIMQKHIKKLFPGCHSLGIKQSSGSGQHTIESVHSFEGDILLLQQPVEVNGAIEIWLNNLVTSIQDTLKTQIVECCATSSDKFNERTLNKYSIQVLSTTRAIHFTKQAEKSITSISLPKLHKALNAEITEYAALKHQTKDALLQIKLRALLLDLVHYATIVEELQFHNVTHTSDWHWLCQLKFYLSGADGQIVLVRIVYAEFEYSYEFLGNPNKLVSTSLTQKCYLILTQAMHMGLGGNPFGPAGTGKTECVKALGAMLGRLVLVFNCDENVDTESMSLILTGLSRCGAWGCFDEFNRLQEATLSAISMLIQPIQTALKDKSDVVQISGKKIRLNQHCGIFVTLNPAGAEYGGRQKLPGNIQALFRSIVMQQPDSREISRVMLFVEGFQEATEIAERIVEIFDMCAKMLSTQRHYDWGLRELKTVLLACGAGLRERLNKSMPKTKTTTDIFKSRNKKLLDNATTGDDGEIGNHTTTDGMNTANTEMSIVVQSLRASTMSKLALHDIARFDMLLENVFPEIKIAAKCKSALEEALSAAFTQLGLCPNDMQIEKALQLHEQLIKRMGVVVVGPPGCGKSTIIALLRHALTTNLSTSAAAAAATATPSAGTKSALGSSLHLQHSAQIRLYTINPKSMSRVQLLGRLDPDTRQWKDGVLTNTAVTVNAEDAHVHSWIVCDGSIDPEWIEALNSVLDDNKLLTLPSGWRIQFGNNVNFIFETDDVRHASPATISRMGIVNMSLEDYPQRQLLDSLCAKEKFGDLLRNYIDEYFLPAAEWVEKEFLHTIPALSRVCLLRALFLHIQGTQSKDEFCVALCRALFGFLPTERHNELANFIFDKANIYVPNPSRTELVYFNNDRGTVDFYGSETNTFDIEQNTDEPLLQTAVVKTGITILQRLLETPASTPFLIVGPTGAAKTLMLQYVVQDFSGYELVIINCSTQLTPAYIVHSLKQNCVTVSGVRGREYKPKQVRLVLLLKDLDLCYLDAWGASEVIEFLMQLVQRNGFYADNLEWINVSGVQICGTISQDTSGTNAGLHKIAPRYLAMNQFLRLNYPSDSDMLNIVQSRLEPLLMGGRFQTAGINVQYVAEGLMQFLSKLQSTFISTSQGHAHYQFSPKFIMKLLRNLKYYPVNAFNEALSCELISTFKDRLTTNSEVDQFETIMRQNLRKFYGKEKIFFVPKSPKHDSELHALQHDDWMDEVQKHVTICNAESFQIEEPITRELLEQAAKIARLFSRNETHLLLLGAPGGRQIDAVNVAVSMQQAKLHMIQGSSSYGLADFYTDLKLAIQMAALENQCTCLLIDHWWISFAPSIMKPIEAILEGSEILDLFGDDMESVASSLKHAAQLEGSQESLSAFFMRRAKSNLHLIISLDPSSPTVNEYFTRFPALYRKTEFLYIRNPSKETQEMLPKKYISMLCEMQGIKGKVPVSSYFMDALENVLLTQAPQRFHQLIRTYFFTYSQLSTDIDKRLNKLQHGVDKLAAAHTVVDTLKSNAVKQEEALAEKRKLANDALEMISATMRSANDQKANMLELKKQTQVSSEKLKERQKEIQQELSEVEPILAEASAAVGQIKSEALSEIRSLRAPPEAIRDILEGVLRLMGIRDTSWNSMKTFLAKRGVKEDIRSLDPARINPENCDAVEKLLASKADSFEMKNAKRASAAAAPLAAWVKASVRYSKVIQSIKPLEREQNELKRNLDVAENEMQSLVTGLDDVDNRVKQLSAKLNAYTQEAAVLELKLEQARATLNAAEVLVEKLSAEFHTWSMQVEEYKTAHKTLEIKSLLISVVINYLAHMSLERRAISVRQLCNELQLKQAFDLRKNLLTEQEQIIWESMGLARDAQVIENAALLRQMLQLPFGSCPVPLLIDPTQTAVTWLEEYLRSNGKSFELTSQNNVRLTYSLELAVRFGKVLIVQECQELRPPLLQLIACRFHVKFNKKQLEVGSKSIDLHEHFQLVLCSKTHKLSIPAESATLLNYVPFTVTAVGLSDQLMSKAIVMQKPELEQKRIELLKNEGILLKQRIELEDKLLEELSSAQGDILNNEKLLQTLNEVKESSSFIDKSLKESARIKETLMGEYNQLKDLTNSAAQFYMGLTTTYEMSVHTLIKLFLQSLESYDAGDNAAQRETRIYKQLVCACFQYLARSTPRASQLTLALFVCKNSYPDVIKSTEWEMFITNFMSSADASIGSVQLEKIQLPECVSKEAGIKLQMLLTQAPQLAEQLQLQNEYEWRNFIEGKTNALPGKVTSSFHAALLMQIFRADLLTTQLRQITAQILGITPDSIAQPTVERLAEESNSDKPILIITQAENDPATEIKSVAIKFIGREHYNEVSIGKGMERRALDSVKQAAEAGMWICVKNVHLVPNWLTDLERELEATQPAKGFRLWLICESTAGFNESVMYKFNKVLYEYPSGLKQKLRHMLQAYAASDQQLPQPANEPKLLKIRVVLFILTAVLQERRRYIPQGWSKYYEFGEADLKAALEVLRWLDGATVTGRCDWQIMQRLCENVAYGGRISNTRDLQVLQSYLAAFFQADVLSNRWSPLTLNITIPTSAQIQDYFRAINKFPDIDEPETFGLSKHSNISREIEHSKEIIKDLRAASFNRDHLNWTTRASSAEGENQQNQTEKHIKPLLSLWRKLAGKCTVVQTAKDMAETEHATTPWTTFVTTELKIAANCFQEVHNSLSFIHNWLKEAQARTGAPPAAEVLQSLTENQVPSSWRKLWSGPQTAVDFLKGLVVRAQAAEKRYRAEASLEFTEQLDLTTIFNCEALFSCYKLIISRKLQVSCKNLELFSYNAADTAEGDSLVMKFAPLKLDGAIVVNGKLCLSSTSPTDTHDQDNKIPEIHVVYRRRQEKNTTHRSSIPKQTNIAPLPLYTNANREKLICYLNVSSTESTEAVLLSGAALIVADF